MRYLELKQVLWLHRRLIETSGGALGVRDMATLESAITQPMMSVGGVDAYPGLIDKAAALCFSLVCNHPFVDGNKRIGHAAAEVFLLLNGHGGNELKALTRELHHRTEMFLCVCDWYRMARDVYPQIFQQPGEHADSRVAVRLSATESGRASPSLLRSSLK